MIQASRERRRYYLVSILPSDLGRIPVSETAAVHRVEAKQGAQDYAGKEQQERRSQGHHTESDEQLPHDAVDVSEEYLSGAHEDVPTVRGELDDGSTMADHEALHLDIEV